MPVRTQISEEEYLSASFPDLDYENVHGELIERGMYPIKIRYSDLVD